MPEDDHQTKDEALLQEIRERYRYASDAWRKIREERQIDLRYLSGDPWDPKDKKARADFGRPAINHDQLNQWVFQGVNNLRQNKRGIKVEPRGNGADDRTATLRQDQIRTIEYRSKAQMAYLRAAQDMYEGSYGFFRITRKYISDDSDDQEIIIKPIPNPDSVLLDPDYKEADASDDGWAFVLEPLANEEFKRRYPDAERTDFTGEDMRVATDWIKDKTVLVAEYWKIESTPGKGKTGRAIQKKQVVQYITNGVEILERLPQPGIEIPIIPMFGLERYVDDGSGPERQLYSLIRLAREPQMSLAYLCSQEMEEAGMTPKTPVMGYTGQFETDEDNWTHLNKKPVAFIQVDPVTDATGQTILPLPQWKQYVPNFEAYEAAKDACTRAIMAAIGISPLPTAAQRQNEKSGIALDKIQQEQAIGSYHFVEGFERALERAGRIIESWIPVVYDTERLGVGLQQADDSRRVVNLNTAEPYPDPKTGEMVHYPIGEEEHDVTVSTGPSNISERDAVDKFLDNLLANLPTLPVPPPAAAKLLAMAIRMKDLGPKGDQMADIIDPQQGDPSQQLQGLQQQLQAQGQAAQQMQAELQQLRLEKQGKVVDNEYKLQIEKMREENQLAIAEINTKAQQLSERVQTFADQMAQFHSQAHDAASQASDQAHQQGMAQAQQNASQQQQMQAQQQAPPPQPGNPQTAP